jgi:predicted small lipoprotein YifL
MLREIAAVAPPAARLVRLVTAGVVALAIAGCGIKGPLRLPPAPPGAGSGTPSTSPPETTPKPEPGAIPPDASPRG